ncbi:SufS family cysteine desulfurase [Candidatus Roizmanbacteria bacterium]|nr:SufS family cysteine desulfurase [Candidatus Roizmanbacteria bacterium]
MLNPDTIKKDFPIFKNIPELIYLDSTATSLKPKIVIDKLREYYETYSANIYRGIYHLSERATEEYEKTREIIVSFIHAKSSEEVIFTRNTSESLNLLCYSLGEEIIKKGDEIATTIMEHHSNFVPWQQLLIKKGGKLAVIKLDKDGGLDVLHLEKYISKKTKILCLTYVSNVLGVANEIKKIIQNAKKINPSIITIVDAAQAVPHRKVDVQDLGCDFLAFSSHKMLGPTGVGVLWGRKTLLDAMPPFLYGGEMISEVHVRNTKFKETPHKFEAGTPAIAEVIALKEAVRYLEKVGLKEIENHEQKLASYAIKRLGDEFKNLHVIGPKNAENKGGIVSFYFKKYHPHDVAQILSEKNICVRAGNHCAMPLHEELNLTATVRASFYLYNTQSDVDALIDGLHDVSRILK